MEGMNSERLRIIKQITEKSVPFNRELGLELLQRVEQDLAEFGIVEQEPKMEGRQMVMVIAPKKH